MPTRYLFCTALLAAATSPAWAYDARTIVTYDNQTHVRGTGDVEHDHSTDVPAGQQRNSFPVHHSDVLSGGRWYTIHLRLENLGACKVVMELHLSPVACVITGREDHVVRCDSACSTSGKDVSVTVKAMWP